MGDIDHHIIVKKVGQPPQSLKDSFIQMGNVGVLEQSLAKNLAPSAGLRNALIHMYEDIEIGFIQEAIKKTFQFVPLYIKQVEKSV